MTNHIIMDATQIAQNFIQLLDKNQKIELMRGTIL
jgi:hypothetical protein